MKVNEGYLDETIAKDGGVIFQAIISHSISWEIINGETHFDQKNIKAKLHRVDVFPDLKYTEGYATSTYYILSEVNILKRKFDLASEAIKKLLVPEYAMELNDSPGRAVEFNSKYFKNTKFSVNLTTDNIVLREVSTSGLDSGSPAIVLKSSTGMVDTLDGQPINSWDNFRVRVSGTGANLDINNNSDTPISKIAEYDEVDNRWEVVFQTIIPSLVLNFIGERVEIETYTNRTSEVAFKSPINIETIFNEGEVKEVEMEGEETLSDEEINN